MYAPGIKSKEDYGDLSKLEEGQLLDYYLTQHNAQRAGTHYDLRVGDPDLNLYSWAIPKAELPEPGGKRLAVQTQLHSYPYGKFVGTIHKGYGAGTVHRVDAGKVLLTKVTPNSIHFTIAHKRYPERFALTRTKGKNWLLVNTTLTDVIPTEKTHFKLIDENEVEPILQNLNGSSVSAKVDGASSLIQLLKNKAELVSYRTSKVTNKPIVHSERVFKGSNRIDAPKDLMGTVLRGELYGEQDGQVLPPQATGGLLNSSVAKSIEDQKRRHAALKVMLFDVENYKGKPLDKNTVPFTERQRILKEIAGYLPTDKFHIAEQVTDSDKATAMWEQIKAHQHPLTQEGIIVQPELGPASKAKIFPESDVYITGTFPGEGKYKSAIGGFTYSLEPNGKTVGKLGTGLSDEMRFDAAKNPDAYIGRVARIRSQDQHQSGAHRVPALIALHEDYPTNEKSAAYKMGAFLSRIAELT